MAQTVIIDDRIDNLQISEDTGRDNDEPVAVLLFTPSMAELMNHHHIELSIDRAAALHAWLARFLHRHGRLNARFEQ